MSIIDNISLQRANNVSTAFDSGIINENTTLTYSNLFYPYILDNGGNSKSISLTIDILNKEDLQNDTGDMVNKDWVKKDRLTNDLIVSKDIWGFKETSHLNKKSKAISNGFCFDGQKITFYIATKGDGTGQIDTQWIYCKTTLIITVTDLVNGTNTILKTFDNFSVKDTDSTRYFTYTIPFKDQDVFADCGLFGLCVIKLDVAKEYFYDAERKNPVTTNSPNKNQGYLQLLIYSGAREIRKVNAGDIDILKPFEIPSYDDTLEQIFSKTIFESIDNISNLTSDQKRAIIADQIAVLFMSQHSVVNADFYPSKIIGAGVQDSVPPRKVIQRAITYSLKYPDIVPLVEDRLYGMFAVYKTFNFTKDIVAVIPNDAQSDQIVRDPVRTILMDKNNVLTDDLGVNGIIFDPYALKVSNAEFLTYVPETSTMDCLLVNEFVDISNIEITNWAGGDLVPYATEVMIEFEVTYGADNIDEVRYSIFTDNSLNYDTYLDENDTSTSHYFTLPYPIVIDPTFNGDIVTAQIDILDIYGNVISFIKTQYIQGYTVAPALANLKIYQRNTGDKIVDIYYDYIGIGEITNAYLYVQFSINNGVTWSTVPVTSLKGDYGYNVQPGRRLVTWMPETDLNGVTITGNVLCRLTLYDIDKNLALGDNLTGVLVWNINKPEVAIRKLSEEEELEMLNTTSSSSESNSSSSSS
jgi:hypothetical protein